MYKLELISRWNQVKEKLKRRYNMLTDEDLMFRMGREGELIIRLQRKLGKTRADVMRMIGEAN
ncbi:MAG TPA: general stress protein CsbD [Chryseosolibacter sp.]